MEAQSPSPRPAEVFRSILQQSTSPMTWQTWLAPLEPSENGGGAVVVAAPSEFHRRWVDERHRSAIEDAVARAFGADVEMTLTVDTTVASGVAVETTDNIAGDLTPTPQPDPHTDTPLTPRPPMRGIQDFESRLISKYTFENFVVGQSNRFAHAAAMAVAEQPGSHYNPLFVHGHAGLGKTHLLHAVGHHRRELAPGSVVRYVSSEQFFNEFINGIRRKTMTEFKARYRTIDVLLLDDVQFFEGKEQILEEFFHTFNSLYEAGKQLVISADRHPKDLATLEDRLRSRFEWGLLTDIQPPDVETRLAILRKNAEFAPRPVPREVLEFIAQNVSNNIRELEGALTRVTAYASLTNERITLDMAQEVLQDIVAAREPRAITPELIIRQVGETYQLSVADLTGPSRKQPLALSRQIAMYMSRELTDLSLPRIGKAFGGRDHTTVMHAVDRVKRLMQSDKRVFDEVTNLCQDLRRT